MLWLRQILCLTLAILIGRNRYRKKINSLKFFEGNIREVAAWQPDRIERELQFQQAVFRRRGARYQTSGG